jgi:hypothetical protein
MIRKLGCLNLGFLVFAAGLSLPAWSAPASGVVSGYVRNSGGTPQMGATVEVVGTALRTLKAFTDDRGFYSIAGILPGTYSLKVQAPSFLPALREKIGIRPGSKVMVNVTLTTLFEAVQLGPLRGPADDDDWRWTLRSVSNRPILRVLPDGTTVVADRNSADLKGGLVFMAGSAAQGFGGDSDMSTGFFLEHPVLSTGTLSLNGNLGYGSYGNTVPVAVLRTSYTNHFTNGFEPSVALTVRRFTSPDASNLRNGSLQALSLSSADRMVLGDMLELKVGSEAQTIQFLGHVNTFKPFGSASLHLTPNTIVAYQYASSVPTTQPEKSSDVVPSDLGSGPRMSITNFAPAVERAHHNEVSISQRFGKTNVQVALYADRIADPALTGIGEITAESGEVLPNIDTGTFNYQGNNFSSRGMRVVLQRKLMSDITATLDYAYGDVLDLARPNVELQDARKWIRAEHRDAVAAKLSGTVPGAKTHWIASYRWTNGQALTPVDLFNTSAGQADPYFNLFVRQPLPCNLFPGHMEILLDLRNLLAQGYVPVMAKDGHTLYLVQSARSVRGGVAFNF